LKKSDTESLADDSSELNDTDSVTLGNLQKLNDENTHVSIDSSRW